MRNVNWKRRNWCAAAILVLYFVVNALAIGFYHFASPIQIDHNQTTVTEVILGLCVVLTILFFATAWFWARAKNWPGFVGAVTALGGCVLWLGGALAVIAPYIGREMSATQPSIPVNNWLPILPWVAFTFTAVILKLIPVRKTSAIAGTVPDAA